MRHSRCKEAFISLLSLSAVFLVLLLINLLISKISLVGRKRNENGSNFVIFAVKKEEQSSKNVSINPWRCGFFPKNGMG
jgi:hypothetical protein